MNKFVIAIFLSISFLAVTGCSSLSRSDRMMLRDLRAHGISPTSEMVKHPALAGGLNLLPGFGNFYLAYGTEDSDQWLFGFLNLITWPASVVWGLPEAIIDANTINKKETIYFYKFDPVGQRELQQIKSSYVGNGLAVGEKLDFQQKH